MFWQCGTRIVPILQHKKLHHCINRNNCTERSAVKSSQNEGVPMLQLIQNHGETIRAPYHQHIVHSMTLTSSTHSSTADQTPRLDLGSHACR
eukprot:UN2350